MIYITIAFKLYLQSKAEMADFQIPNSNQNNHQGFFGAEFDGSALCFIPKKCST
jgi:hypothetical protein